MSSRTVKKSAAPKQAEPVEQAEQVEPVEPVEQAEQVEPASAKLDAPAATDDEPETPDEIDVTAATGVGMVEAEAASPNPEGPVIYDAETGQVPDPDAVFSKLFEHGGVLVCNVRLHQATYVGPHRMRTDRLVLPKGAKVGPAQAELVKDAIRQSKPAQ